MAVEGHERLWEAMVSLAERYGLETWQHPEGWGEWQTEKAKTRKAMLRAVTRSYQRRLFRVYGGFLDDIADEKERREESEKFWNECYPVAHVRAKRRMGL